MDGLAVTVYNGSIVLFPYPVSAETALDAANNLMNFAIEHSEWGGLITYLTNPFRTEWVIPRGGVPLSDIIEAGATFMESWRYMDAAACRAALQDKGNKSEPAEQPKVAESDIRPQLREDMAHTGSILSPDDGGVVEIEESW